MQNAGQQYGQGGAPSHQTAPFSGHSDTAASGGSITTSLRQFRRKIEEKHPHSDNNNSSNAPTESHVARVAPHSHYPPRSTAENYRFPHQYQDYGLQQPVKYSEISEPHPPLQEHIPQSVIQKAKSKEYMEMCNVPQQHMKPTYDHLNGQQGYPEANVHSHSQYMPKEPQIHPTYKPESQYFPKETQYAPQMPHQIPKYNMPAQVRKYPPENDFLSKLRRIHPTMARSIMSDHHMQESQNSYQAMDQNRMYPHHQNQRYMNYPSMQNSAYSHGYMPYSNYPPSCSYNRQSQMAPPRFPINPHERSISPRRGYPDNMGLPMNYAGVQPQKMPPNYSQYNTPEYAQHYQHRRAPVAQDYYQQHCSPAQYLPPHQMPPQEIPENRVTVSDSIKHYIENWADEETASEMTQIENSRICKDGIRGREDQSTETVYMISSSELEYIENGIISESGIPVPVVTSETGQYIIKSGVSIENGSEMVRLVEKSSQLEIDPATGERVVNLHIMDSTKPDCMLANRPNDLHQRQQTDTSYAIPDKPRVVVHQNTVITSGVQNTHAKKDPMSTPNDPAKLGSSLPMISDTLEEELNRTVIRETADKNCSPINLDQLEQYKEQQDETHSLKTTTESLVEEIASIQEIPVSPKNIPFDDAHLNSKTETKEHHIDNLVDDPHKDIEHLLHDTVNRTVAVVNQEESSSPKNSVSETDTESTNTEASNISAEETLSSEETINNETDQQSINNDNIDREIIPPPTPIGEVVHSDINNTDENGSEAKNDADHCTDIVQKSEDGKYPTALESKEVETNSSHVIVKCKEREVVEDSLHTKCQKPSTKRSRRIFSVDDIINNIGKKLKQNETENLTRRYSLKTTKEFLEMEAKNIFKFDKKKSEKTIKENTENFVIENLIGPKTNTTLNTVGISNLSDLNKEDSENPCQLNDKCLTAVEITPENLTKNVSEYATDCIIENLSDSVIKTPSQSQIKTTSNIEIENLPDCASENSPNSTIETVTAKEGSLLEQRQLKLDPVTDKESQSNSSQPSVDSLQIDEPPDIKGDDGSCSQLLEIEGQSNIDIEKKSKSEFSLESHEPTTEINSRETLSKELNTFNESDMPLSESDQTSMQNVDKLLDTTNQIVNDVDTEVNNKENNTSCDESPKQINTKEDQNCLEPSTEQIDNKDDKSLLDQTDMASNYPENNSPKLTETCSELPKSDEQETTESHDDAGMHDDIENLDENLTKGIIKLDSQNLSDPAVDESNKELVDNSTELTVITEEMFDSNDIITQEPVVAVEEVICDSKDTESQESIGSNAEAILCLADDLSSSVEITDNVNIIPTCTENVIPLPESCCDLKAPTEAPNLVEMPRSVDQKVPDQPEVQYRNVIRVEESSVLLEIAGELVEINVNNINGKNVITVVPISDTAVVDFNDNYENFNNVEATDPLKLDEASSEPAIESVHVIETKEPEPEIQENTSEIIIGMDLSLEEEINLDVDQPPVLCTKAAKKAYDCDLQIPSITTSGDVLDKNRSSRHNHNDKVSSSKEKKKKSKKSKADSSKQPKQILSKRSSGKSDKKSIFSDLIAARNRKKLRVENIDPDEDEFVPFKELIKARKLRKIKEKERKNIEDSKVDSTNKIDEIHKENEPGELEQKHAPAISETEGVETTTTEESEKKSIKIVEKESSSEKPKEDKEPASVVTKPVKRVSFSDIHDEIHPMESKINVHLEEPKDLSSTESTSSKTEDTIMSRPNGCSSKSSEGKKKLSLEEYNRRKRKVASDNKEEYTEAKKLKIDRQVSAIESTKTSPEKIKLHRAKSLDDINALKSKETQKRKMYHEYSPVKQNYFDWEETQSPKVNLNRKDQENKVCEFKGLILDNSKSKVVIDINDLSSRPSTESSEDEILQNYKEQVESKLNTLNIQIPRTVKPVERQVIETFSKSEMNTLIDRFLKNEKLNSEEMEKIRKIISYKRLMQQLKKIRTHDLSRTASASQSYEVRKEMSDKQTKLLLKKVSEKKKSRFRNLYTHTDTESETDLRDKSKCSGDYSVVQSNCLAGVVPKLIIKRKPELPLPFVRLERLDLGLLGERNKKYNV